MGTIILNTKINAQIRRCFELSTSIDLHQISANKSKEQAISGITTGFIKLNESVTWKAKHFGVWHKMTVKITEFKEPDYFVDEMVKGTFRFMKHKHEFVQNDNHTMMTDKFSFASPLGFLGKLVDDLVMNRYMTKFLTERNNVIKEFAETEKWKQVLQIKTRDNNR